MGIDVGVSIVCETAAVSALARGNIRASSPVVGLQTDYHRGSNGFPSVGWCFLDGGDLSDQDPIRSVAPNMTTAVDGSTSTIAPVPSVVNALQNLPRKTG